MKEKGLYKILTIRYLQTNNTAQITCQSYITYILYKSSIYNLYNYYIIKGDYVCTV